MDQTCKYCKARYFKAELNSSGKYTKCCMNGTVRLDPIPLPTPLVRSCLSKTSPEGKMFHRKASIYNSQLSMSSINFKHDRSAGWSAVTIMGRVSSFLGPVHALSPAFLSHYYYEGGVNVESAKLSHSEKLLLRRLRLEMQEYSPILESIYSHEEAYGAYANLPYFKLQFSNVVPEGQHAGVYNAPTVLIPDIGMVFNEPDQYSPAHRRVNVAFNDDTLGYSLFHMHGDTGWHRDM
jgi:hypothetical protein